MSKGKWYTIQRVGPRGLLKGRWLADPEGRKVAAFHDEVLARQISAAMNLTTQAQRVAYLADEAGYTRSTAPRTAKPAAPLSEAMARALDAVSRGLCGRHYDAAGNVMQGCEGVSSQTLRRAERARLIEDDPASRGNHVRLRLTAAGADALAGARRPRTREKKHR
jgi:hypothetical protein